MGGRATIRRIAVAALAVCSACATDPRLHGPMKVRNQHPAQLIVAHLDPRPAVAVGAGDARIDVTQAYTSLFLAGQEPSRGAAIVLDGEVWRSAAAARVGLGAGFDLAVELPFVHSGGGFLDAFVIDWHDAFGFPDQGRDDAPRDRFAIGTAVDGAPAWSMDAVGFALADVPIELGWTPLSAGPDSPLGFGLRAAVELPTGDAGRGIGSGGIDVALGAFGEWRCEAVSITAQAQHTFATSSDLPGAASLRLRDVTSLGLGAEIAVHDRLWLLVQTEWETSTLRGIPLDRASDPQWLLWTGLRYAITDSARVEIGLGEDLSPFIAPDFSAWLAFAIDFGP